MTVRRPFAAILAGTLALAGCGPPTPATPSTPTAASVAPTATGSPPASPPAGSAPPSAAAAVVDPTLLGILPADIDGRPLLPDAATAADIAGNEDLAPDIEAIAVGLYAQPGSSTAPDGLAIVNVVRLRPGIFDDGWFRSWRSTYDEGACQIAGGVTAGAAETRIGDHDTHIGSCQGGAHTYHVHLVGPDRVVSITSVGEGRLGERVVAGLTE